MPKRRMVFMTLTLNFYKVYKKADDATGTPAFSITQENIRFYRECFFILHKAMARFRESKQEDGVYLVDAVTEGRRVHSFNKFLKAIEKEDIHVNKKSKEYQEGDVIRFPSGCGSRSGQLARVEFVDDAGLGLDFKYDINGKLKGPSQEFWDWEDLEEYGAF